MTTTITAVPLTPELVEAAKEIMAAADSASNDQPVDPKYHVTAEFVEAPKAQVAPLLKKWRAAKKRLDERKTALEDIERKIKDLMDGAEVLVIEETQQQVVESRVSTSQVLDTAKLKKEQAALVQKYQRTRFSRNFRVLI